MKNIGIRYSPIIESDKPIIIECRNGDELRNGVRYRYDLDLGYWYEVDILTLILEYSFGVITAFLIIFSIATIIIERL